MHIGLLHHLFGASWSFVVTKVLAKVKQGDFVIIILWRWCKMAHVASNEADFTTTVFSSTLLQERCRLISCIVGITALRVCLWVAAVRRRTQNVKVAQENFTSVGISRKVTDVQRLDHVPPTNPDAPPAYVMMPESSDLPPYTANPANCPIPTSTQDTPAPQPLTPEFSPSIPNEDDPPKYIPPPGSNQETLPLLEEKQWRTRAVQCLS